MSLGNPWTPSPILVKSNLSYKTTEGSAVPLDQVAVTLAAEFQSDGVFKVRAGHRVYCSISTKCSVGDPLSRDLGPDFDPFCLLRNNIFENRKICEHSVSGILQYSSYCCFEKSDESLKIAIVSFSRTGDRKKERKKNEQRMGIWNKRNLSLESTRSGVLGHFSVTVHPHTTGI